MNREKIKYVSKKVYDKSTISVFHISFLNKVMYKCVILY